jgi:hypothetical protein
MWRMRRLPRTFWIGLILLIAVELLLIVDLHLTGRGAVRSAEQLAPILQNRPDTALGWIARLVAVNLTPLCWAAYLLILEGLLIRLAGRSPVRQRPHHFATLCLASISIWCLFDLINFFVGVDAWRYIGIPPRFHQRILGYLVAFATIVPGMLMTTQALLCLGAFNWARSRPWRMPGWALALSFVAGAAMLAWPLVSPDPVTNLTLWTSLVFFLDPINYALGRPSMLRDWSHGWYGRTLALFAGGLACGLLWEFWNYWALAKWTYHLPFLGAWEDIRYFEMPVPGLLGFLPFAVECWVRWQTIRLPLRGLVEEPPGERWVM